MMVIRNGIAVVAYANYGQSGNIGFENQLEIHDDLYTIEQHRADALNSNEPGIKLASAIYDELIIKTLRSLFSSEGIEIPYLLAKRLTASGKDTCSFS